MINKIKLLILTITLFLLTSCASVNFTQYRSSEILQGKGGSIRVIDGVDFWENGEPDQKYKIIGVIDYKGNDAPISNLSMNTKIAKKAKENGGNGVILVSEEKEIRGSTTQFKPTAFGGTGINATSVNKIKKLRKFYVIQYVN